MDLYHGVLFEETHRGALKSAQFTYHTDIVYVLFLVHPVQVISSGVNEPADEQIIECSFPVTDLSCRLNILSESSCQGFHIELSRGAGIEWVINDRQRVSDRYQIQDAADTPYCFKYSMGLTSS